MNEQRARIREHVGKSIRVRVRVYALIFLVMAVLVILDVVRVGPRSVLPVLACVVGGALVGVLASRMFAMSWDTVSSSVVGKLDVIGGVILVLYILFSIFRSRLLGLWIEAPVLGVASLAALAGVMAGQVVGTGRGVRRVLVIVAGR